MSQFAKNLKELRRYRKINQTKLAEMLQLGDRNIVETEFLMLKILRRGKKDVVAQLLSRVHSL